MRFSGSKWSTLNCGRCGEPHYGYSGKLDKDDVEYVICGVTNKRMNVGEPVTPRDKMYLTRWSKSRERLFYPVDETPL